MRRGTWTGMLSGEEFRAASLRLAEMWPAHCGDFEGWRWRDCSRSLLAAPDSARGYLALEDVAICLGEEQGSKEAREREPADEESDYLDIDSATQVISTSSKYCFCTYHVLYSESYRVPRLYFQCRFPDGRILSWEEVEHDMLVDCSMDDECKRWTFVTQEEHPYLRKPWFSLHPCGTSSLMSAIFEERCCTALTIEVTLSGDCKRISEGSKILRDSDWLPERADTACLASASKYACSLSTGVMQLYLFTWLSFASQAVGLRLPSGFYKFFL